MLRLILLRHAKSTAEVGRFGDFDRGLAPRGREATPLVGAYLARERLIPDRALVSSARRTRETFAGLLSAFDSDMEIRITRELYDAMERGYADLIRRHGGPARTLLVVGHNPATEETAQALAGRGDGALAAAMRSKFPTAAFAVIAFELDAWADVAPGSGRLTHFVRPRDLGGPDGD